MLAKQFIVKWHGAILETRGQWGQSSLAAGRGSSGLRWSFREPFAKLTRVRRTGRAVAGDSPVEPKEIM